MLKCLYFNARSIVNKLQDLELCIKDENYDIIGITETWLTDKILDSEICMEDYTLLRRDRKYPNKTRGGGVAIYIKNNLKVIERSDLTEELFPESIWCSIICNGFKTLLGICYRAPDNLAVNDEAMFTLINKASQENVIIIGDFNFPEINWADVKIIGSIHPFINCIQDSFLDQVIDKPSREKNYLDLVLTSDRNFVQNVIVGEPFSTSDHQTICFDLVVEKVDQQVKIVSYNYFKTNYEMVRENAKLRQWELIDESVDIDKNWTFFKKELLELRENFILKQRSRINKCKWVTKEVIRCRRAKKKAWNKYVRAGKNQQLYNVYRSKLRESVKVNNMAKENFETKLANNAKNDSKSFFSYIRNKQRSKDKVGHMKDNQGCVVSEDEHKATLLNNYFSSVFTVEDNTYVPDPIQIFKGNISHEGLNNIDITEEVVYKKLSEINVNKSCGPDDLHPKLLHELRSVIAGPLTKIFKISLKYGVMPQDWKDANVTPLFKKGAKDKCENYRPISLTSVVGKMLESIVKDKFVEHLDRFKLLHDSQHGFRRGRSCLTNLLDLMESVTQQIDEGNPVDVIYLDFAKAFDKVPYKRLYKKINSHGIGGKALSWVKEWLTDRRQRVGVNKVYSSYTGVTSGVPQGSVLGPILFLIYINDIDVGLVSKLSKFADDCKLYRPVVNNNEMKTLQEDLDKIHKWSETWQMKFNVDKCATLHLGHGNMREGYSLGQNQLKSSEIERDLGVYIHNNGKVAEQCKQVIKAANSTLGIIRRHITCKKKDIVIKLYKALVRPKLEYCIQAWRPYLKQDIESIEKVQHRATKMIRECRGMSYEDRLRFTELTTLDKRRDRGDLIQVFKIIKGFDNVDYRHFFVVENNTRTRGHRYKLAKFRSRLNIRRNFFSQRVINKWNELPASVVEAESVNSFKNRLDKHWTSVAAL